jgi:hypothetical protein
MHVAPCSNCGSSDLRVTTTDAVGHFGPDLLPDASGVFHRAKFDVVVCCSCGLTHLTGDLRICECFALASKLTRPQVSASVSQDRRLIEHGVDQWDDQRHERRRPRGSVE